MQTEKPKKSYQTLGDGVKLSIEKQERNSKADTLLGNAGELQTPHGLEYTGSVCVHFYKSPTNLLGISTDAVYLSHLLHAKIDPAHVRVAIQELIKQFMREDGAKMRSTDPNYQVKP